MAKLGPKKYIGKIKRFCQWLVVIGARWLVICFVLWTLLHQLSGSIEDTFKNQETFYSEAIVLPQSLTEMRLPPSWWQWLLNVGRGNFGVSAYHLRPNRDLIFAAAKESATLLSGALVCTFVFSALLGYGLTWIKKVISTPFKLLIILISAVPGFMTAFLLLRISPFSPDSSLVFPYCSVPIRPMLIASCALPLIAQATLVFEASVLKYRYTLDIKQLLVWGISKPQREAIVINRAFKNLTSELIERIPSILMGSVFVELFFSVQGLGSLLYASIMNRDLSLTMACLLITTFFYLLALSLKECDEPPC